MNKINHILITFFLGCLFGNPEIFASNPGRIIVPTGTYYIDANSSPYNRLGPGDTLFFQGGDKQYLQLKNFRGDSRLPIVFINLNGMVTINTNWYYGIVLNNCRYVRLTGTGDTRYFYGFMVSRVAGGAGLSIGELSSDVEVDHIYIANTSIAGVYAKTDPDCTLTSVRSNFTQYNTVFHDNYFSNTGNEGMYIGSSFYSGETITCNGKDTVVLPSVLKGVRVYNNIVKYSGWDGIQVGSATTDCLILNNLVMYDSQAGVNFQMSGILIGGGSDCDCYNNYIYKGKGDAIESLGLGNYKIYNNVIVNPGWNYYPADPSKMKYGIYVGDVSCVQGNSFSILFNDIINPKTNGIRFSSTKSKNNLIASNAIIGPGAGTNGYIVLTSPSCEVLEKNNYFSMTSSGAGFADTTYALLQTSPLIDAGYPDNKNVTYDYFYHPRPYGKGFDIGINEYNPQYPPMKEALLKNIEPSDSVHSLERPSSLRIDRLPFPDPAESKLSLTYSIDSSYNVILDVYNSGGIQIYHYEDDEMVPGSHIIDLDVRDYPAGVCLFTLRAGKEAISGRFIKVK
jgi:hypothetical protein